MVCVTLQKPFQTSLRFSNTTSLFKTIFPIQIPFLYHINITKKNTPCVFNKKNPPRNSTNDLPQKTLPNNPQSGNQSMGGGSSIHPSSHLPPTAPSVHLPRIKPGKSDEGSFALRIQIYPGVVGVSTNPTQDDLITVKSDLQKRGYLRPPC